jgi:hypothetical protein
VINAARAGRGNAVKYLRGLVLPPPVSRLDMPIQAILRPGKAAAAEPEHVAETCPHCGAARPGKA